jgi:hypothetical protein
MCLPSVKQLHPGSNNIRQKAFPDFWTPLKGINAGFNYVSHDCATVQHTATTASQPQLENEGADLLIHGCHKSRYNEKAKTMGSANASE